MIANYSRVKLLTNNHVTEGASEGNTGYVIEVYDDAYEVEFSDANGITFAQIVAREEELRVINEEPFASFSSGDPQRKRLSTLK